MTMILTLKPQAAVGLGGGGVPPLQGGMLSRVLVGSTASKPVVICRSRKEEVIAEGSETAVV